MKIKKTLRNLAIALALAGCGLYLCSHKTSEAPKRFRTLVTHFEDARMFANHFHGGVSKRFGADLDFDGDNMNDLYMLTNDGTLYATSSRRLVQGGDNMRERTWTRNDPEILKYAKPGEYESP